MTFYEIVNIDGVVKTTFRQFFVIPAKAGMTEVETFYEIVKEDILQGKIHQRAAQQKQ